MAKTASSGDSSGKVRARIDASAAGKVKVAITDIDGVLRGKYINKDNADCVLDKVTQAHLAHHHRDLEAHGDYLIQSGRVVSSRLRILQRRAREPHVGTCMRVGFGPVRMVEIAEEAQLFAEGRERFCRLAENKIRAGAR